MASDLNALITVRASSTRLTKKCFLTLAGMTVIEFVVSRAQNAGFDPLVCTSDDISDTPIHQLCNEKGYKFFAGNLQNKIERWSDCMETWGFEDAHLIDCDDPFFDPEECKNSLNVLRNSKADLVLTSRKSDSGFASVGSSASRKFMNVLKQRSLLRRHQNFDVIPWKKLLGYQDRVMTMTDSISEIKDVRLTLDYEEDYALMSVLADRFGPFVSRQVIEKYLFENPDLVNINLFRKKDFLDNKSILLNKHHREEI